MHQNIDVGGVLVDLAITAISTSVTFGIGTACATIANFYTRMAVSALAHGVFQGGMTAASGGKFWAGFAAGAVSSIASSFWQGGTDNIKNPVTGNMESVAGTGMVGIGAGTGAVGTIAFASIMGGAASALAGGNFWQGAVTGLIVSTFNHVMHQIKQKKDLIARMKKGNIDPGGNPNFSDAGVEKMNNGVEGLDEAYNAAGSPKVKFDSTDMSEAGHTDPGLVHLNKANITSNYRYASTLFHEYRHAWQWMYKCNVWHAKYGASTMYSLMERDAYGYTMQMGIYSPFDLSDSVIKENFDKYYNITKFIKHF